MDVAFVVALRRTVVTGHVGFNVQIMDLLYKISVTEAACVVCTHTTVDLIHDYMSHF
jgi:hypothetical protein